jgi:hypothetical protein
MLRLAIIISVLAVFGATFLAIEHGEPEWVKRGGAFVAAVAAFLAIVEATVEHKVRVFEAGKPSLEEGEDGRGLFGTGALRLADRIRQTRFRESFGELSESKLKDVFLISGLAVTGELLHGFGDLGFVGVKALLIGALN